MTKRFLIAVLGLLLLNRPTFADVSAQGTTLLEQISEAIAELAEKAKPATVSIKCTLCIAAPEYSNPFDMFGDDFFKKFFGPQFPQGQQQQTSGGSGFLVSSDGYIVTNNHVIKDANQVTVTLNDGTEFIATVKGADSRTDLAVLKIDTTNLPYLTLGDSDLLRAGEMVFALGNPFGLEGTITNGIVSAKGRQDLGIATYEDFIQTDAPINPGNSGGPLLNVRGEVIGVNTAIFSRSGGYMGIGLAIPSKMAQPVIEQIMDNGSVKRAYLGIVLQPIDKELANALNLDKAEGILISDVVVGSPAEKAGLLQGDIIVQYNGKPIKNMGKFRTDVANMSPGQKMQLKILRDGKTESITVELGSQNDGEVMSAELTQKLGIKIETLMPEMAGRLGYAKEVSGVVISEVKPGSPAYMAGLRPSNLITGVVLEGGKRIIVNNITEFESALQEVGDRKYIVLIVRQQNMQRYVTIKLQ